MELDLQSYFKSNTLTVFFVFTDLSILQHMKFVIFVSFNFAGSRGYYTYWGLLFQLKFAHEQLKTFATLNKGRPNIM